MSSQFACPVFGNKEIKGLLLDLYGVVYQDGNKLIDGSAEAIKRLYISMNNNFL